MWDDWFRSENSAFEEFQRTLEGPRNLVQIGSDFLTFRSVDADAAKCEDSSWLWVGSILRHLFHKSKVSRCINIVFAVLLLVSVALAVGV